MNAKQTITQAIRREKTDRVPVALLSGGVWTFNRQGLSLEDLLDRPEQTAEIIVKTNEEEVHSDIVWAGSGYHNLAIRALGGQIKFRAKGAPDVLAPLLCSVSDLERIPWDGLYDDRGIQNLWKTAGFLVGAVGAHTMVGASQWGPFTLAGHLYGVEKLMRSIYKDPEAAFTVLEYTSELCFRLPRRLRQQRRGYRLHRRSFRLGRPDLSPAVRTIRRALPEENDRKAP